MKDRVSNDIGTKEPLQDWSTINWKTVKKRVRNLRQRIYRATQSQQWNQVRSLMKLMLRSYSNLLLSVRRVTQENQGKETAGVDNQTVLNPQDRMRLVKEMETYQIWKAKPTKRIYIPKSNGKRRPLGIPIIRDRVAQAIVKNALEPSWEARFEENSYGFRPGRSCHDAISQCHTRLNQQCGNSWILDADIRGAFDNISHEFLLKTIGQSPGRELIKQWLKAGYVEAEMFHETESGTPQGGIASPLLANIVLNGMDELLSRYTKTRETHSSSKAKHQRITRRKIPRYGFIRYADDFLVTAETKEDIEAIVPVLKQWLKERGLELNEEKTRIVHVEKGVNFLGFTIIRHKEKCLTFPQKDKVLAKLREIREWLKANKQAKPEDVLAKLNPIIQGWGNYYRHGASKEMFSKFDHHLWRALWNWSRKRHPNKGKRWILAKYFKPMGNKSMIFTATVQDRRGKRKSLVIKRLSEIPITRHIKVKGNASPDAPALTKYWEDRKTQYGKTYWNKGSKQYQIAENQNWKCPICGDHLYNGEKLHIHHITKVTDGGTEETTNLLHIHKTCHHQIHSGKKTGSQRA